MEALCRVTGCEIVVAIAAKRFIESLSIWPRVHEGGF
jgi:hypothetical protein